MAEMTDRIAITLCFAVHTDARRAVHICVKTDRFTSTQDHNDQRSIGRVSNVTLCHKVPNFLFLFINFR